MRPRSLIVDGYNVLHAAGRYRELLAADAEAARAALVADLASLSVSGRQCIVVFDGENNPRSDGAPHHVSGVVVIFSPFGMAADAVVESLARRCRDRGEQCVVVTSDAATQWTVLGEGISRMSAAEFASLLVEESGAWQEHVPPSSTKVTIDARVEPEVRAALVRWSRGVGPS